jgi:hypothetical protein
MMAELAEMSDPLVYARYMSTITITYARRMLRLTQEKVSGWRETWLSFDALTPLGPQGSHQQVG